MKTLIQVKTLIQYTQTERPHLAVVTRIWGKRFGKTEYAVHTYNKETNGYAHGVYTTSREEADKAHAEKVERFRSY